MIAASSEQELNALFGVLPVTHPPKAPYSIFKQASEGVRGGVIIGLGSRLQVFQNRDIRNITSYNEIDLELPGKQPCAYYCITSDQDSTFDFLSCSSAAKVCAASTRRGSFRSVPTMMRLV